MWDGRPRPSVCRKKSLEIGRFARLKTTQTGTVRLHRRASANAASLKLSAYVSHAAIASIAWRPFIKRPNRGKAPHALTINLTQT